MLEESRDRTSAASEASTRGQLGSFCSCETLVQCLNSAAAMEGRRTSVWGRTSFFFSLFFLSLAGAEAKGETPLPSQILTLSADHLYYTCPVGATAKLVCKQGGTFNHSDHLRESWLYTPHVNQHCKNGVGPRNWSHKDKKSATGVTFNHTADSMWVILKNLTTEDEGRYCCLAREVKNDHNHLTVVQKTHSHVILHVVPEGNGVTNCTLSNTMQPPASVPVALALAACIFALLSLPLILVLVYKQQQNSRSHRRGQELVRMDSEALGHENPVFLGGSPPTKTRTVSQILTRQLSETGRHLLSDPGTPLSPPAHGDVFFPSEDFIPESEDLVQI